MSKKFAISIKKNTAKLFWKNTKITITEKNILIK